MVSFFLCYITYKCLCLTFLLVPDEESTIEEQEAVEGEADHSVELVDLAKDGI